MLLRILSIIKILHRRLEESVTHAEGSVTHAKVSDHAEESVTHAEE